MNSHNNYVSMQELVKARFGNIDHISSFQEKLINKILKMPGINIKNLEDVFKEEENLVISINLSGTKYKAAYDNETFDIKGESLKFDSSGIFEIAYKKAISKEYEKNMGLIPEERSEIVFNRYYKNIRTIVRASFFEMFNALI